MESGARKFGSLRDDFFIEAEGVLSVLMQTAYSNADAEQFRNKNAFVIYFSMYQD